MKAFKYLIFILFLVPTLSHSAIKYYIGNSSNTFSTPESACSAHYSNFSHPYKHHYKVELDGTYCNMYAENDLRLSQSPIHPITDPEPEPEKCEAGIVPVTLKVPVSSGKMVCVNSCQYSLTKCVDVDFEAGMTCDGVNEGRECGTPPPTTTPTTPPVTQDPTNPTDKTDEQKTFENIMHVIGEKLDSIKDAITGGNQNQNGGDTGGSNGGTTGGDVTVNVDMSETNAKIDETNSLIDELTKWFQGEDLGDDIFGDSEPPEKELTPQQLETNIFSGRAQCPADARLSFNLLGGKTFTHTFEFTDWCDNLEIFGSLILIASYLFGAYIIVSKS
jgi:hypothetical protein